MSNIATRFWTLSELIAKVETDLDLQGEVFIDKDMMIGFANEAIDDLEKLIHGIYEDYFLARYTLTLVSGTDEYALPTNIYAHKIRGIMYRNGSRVYEIKRIRDWKKFIEYSVQLVNGLTADAIYSYFVINEDAGSPRMLLSPRVSESGAYGMVWYLRQANRLVDDADLMDVPEAANYVLRHMRRSCLTKDIGNPLLPNAVAELNKEEADLTATLTAMVPDANNEIEADLSFYQEFV